ncbi:hypothetical protein CALVIDRAFT_150640 [Calocera viscosa TUFC12733]|uniref:Arrestin C-terminal-like domain-containing protein n=1 Tax=Calocera viscosa (strain TUFC12733) TaxID=1330018 RepID=A0A167LJR1_CALVF|nr:hypothetical protein CALVIDRAFT_150640 [Calocera viscosa TUFC12733]
MSSTSSENRRPRSHSQPSLASSFSSLSALPTEESAGAGVGLGISLSAPAPPASLHRRPKHRSGRSSLSASRSSGRSWSAEDEDQGMIPHADSMADLLQLPDDLRTPSRAGLERQPTLLAHEPRPGELDVLLGKNGSGKLRRRSQTLPSLPRSRSAPYGVDLAPQGQQGEKAGGVPLEQAKSRALVELDLRLESSVAVEGGCVRGLVELSVRAPVAVAGGKLRVVGFEELFTPSERHVFYQHSCALAEAAGEGRLQGLFDPSGREDEEGYRPAREGTHRVRFELRLPIGGGAKGCVRTKLGQVRYIIIASLKLKYPNPTGQSTRSIAHFFRPLSLYPLLPPLPTVLAPLPQPLAASASSSKRLSPGELRITAELERGIWVAGGQVWTRVHISNGSGRKVRALSLSLVRCVTAFRPSSAKEQQHPAHHSGSTDPDSDLDLAPSITVRKVVSSSLLESGERAPGKGRASAKGWWVGVDPGSVESVCFSLPLPEEELSVRRSKLLEVAYKLRVSVSCSSTGVLPALGGGGGGEVALELPLWVVAFVSMDPPPGQRVVSCLPGSVEVTPELALGVGVSALGFGGAMPAGAIPFGPGLPGLPSAGGEGLSGGKRQAEQRLIELMHPAPALSVSESEARRGSGSGRGGLWADGPPSITESGVRRSVLSTRDALNANVSEGRRSVLSTSSSLPGAPRRAEILDSHPLAGNASDELGAEEEQRERDQRMIIGDLDWHEQVRISTLQSLHRKQRAAQSNASRTPASSKLSSLSPLEDFPAPPPLDASQRASLELVRSMRLSLPLSAPPSSASSENSERSAASALLERQDSASSTASSVASLPTALKKSRPLPQLPPGASPTASLASSRLSFSALSPLAPPPRIISSPRSFSPPMLRKIPAPPMPIIQPRSVSPASSTSSTMSVRQKVAHFEQAEQVRRETTLGGALSRSSTMGSQRSLALALSPVLGSPLQADVQRGVSFKAPLFKHLSVAE